MLVCPQCQFENPNTNRFCQKCGTSLTHKPCFNCGEPVAFSDLQCHNCGTLTGTLWLAIISTEEPSQTDTPTANETQAVTETPGDAIATPITPAPVAEPTEPVAETPTAEPTEPVAETPVVSPSPETEETTATPVLLNETDETATPPTATISHEEDSGTTSQPSRDRDQTTPADPFPIGAYLDAQQRYQILERVAIAPDHPTEIVVKVLDLQPLQLSPLVALSRQLLANPPSKDQETAAITANWEMAIPAIARLYLSLQAEFVKAIPQIHDAWEQDRHTIILLEDRSALPFLVEDWKQQDLPAEQIVEWLSQLVDLWAALTPTTQRTSLLKIENLRVNEHRQLCLQRLHSDPADATLSLRCLGKLWQELYTRSDRTQLGDVLELQQDLFSAKIQTVEELRSRLDAITADLPVKRPPNATPTPTSAIKSGSTTRLQVDDTTPTNFIIDDDEDPSTLILPMQLMSLEAVGRTDVGRQRDRNEDDFALENQIIQQEDSRRQSIRAKGLYILCDGMGGHAAGEVASATAIKTLREYFHQHWKDQLPSEDTIRQGILLANQAIYDINQQETRSGSGRMGTTLVMALIQDHQVAVAHVGDSRLYCLSRRRSLQQITVDHEVGQREIKRGVEPEIAYSRPDAYQLTQALGPRNEDFIHPDIQFFELDEDMILLLASDGLTDNNLIETHWQTKLLPLLNAETSLDRGARDLIDLANEYNGHDNITVILIRAKVKPA